MFNRHSRMIRVTAILCLLTFPALCLGAEEAEEAKEAKTEDCVESEARGRAAASEQHGSGGWLAGGVLSGVLLGLIGTGIITAIAAGSKPNPAMIPDSENQTCYASGYRAKGKSKNKWAAFGGGLAGTAIFLVIYIAATE